METSTGLRIKQLRAAYSLSVKEFASKSGLSHVAIFHLENGRTEKPHKSSLARIATAFGTSIEWLRTGERDMLPNGKKDIENDSVGEQLNWKNEAYQELKNKNIMLEREVERLWKVVHNLSGGMKQDYARVLDAG